MRESRKSDHIRIALAQMSAVGIDVFRDVRLMPDPIADRAFRDLDTSVHCFGKQLKLPFIINAMTGGIEEAFSINRDLARAAASAGIAMAVGSQHIALRSDDARRSFAVAREMNPEGVLVANVNALAKAEDAQLAVEMIDADALQIHLNLAQELAMPEGDRDFHDLVTNIGELAQAVQVPLIVKEVGSGLTREACETLYSQGIRHFDTGGRGGTSFVEIERKRGGMLSPDFAEWGLSTPVSVAELVSTGLPVWITAAGGIHTGLQAAKALAMGANLIGMAGRFLKAWHEGGLDGVQVAIDGLAYNLKSAMLLCGIDRADRMGDINIIIGGETLNWLEQRGMMEAFIAARRLR